MKHLLLFALHHFLQWDTCPAGDYFSDIICSHFFVSKTAVPWKFTQLGFCLSEFCLFSDELSVTDLSHLFIIGLTLRYSCFVLEFVEVLADILDRVYQFLFILP